MRLGADALYPTFAGEKRKADLPTETVEIMLKQGFVSTIIRWSE